MIIESNDDAANDPSISGWRFDNTYQRLPQTFHQSIKPTPVQQPEVAVFNESLASEMGLKWDPAKMDRVASVLAGNVIPPGSQPIAQAYAGHQFGHFTMLGDGRAILLGEHQTPSGWRIDVQLKGSGRTHYSRGGDGRAALGPMLREFLISEAMHGLGIATTRSLAVVTTGEAVFRESPLPGAILTRVAQSHVRVGTFQYAAGIDDPKAIGVLADYVIDRHDADLAGRPDRYLRLLESVVLRQAELVAQWMLVGFVHGVLNTDNVSIAGETIDYGPCAFMDRYRIDTVFSSIDRQGRYAFGNQPAIMQWNLARFAETLLPLLGDDPNSDRSADMSDADKDQAVEAATEVLRGFEGRYQEAWLSGMRRKLGLGDAHGDDLELIQSLLDRMSDRKLDFTNTFDSLTRGTLTDHHPDDTVLRDWTTRWQQRRSSDRYSEQESIASMRAANPVIIPRNHIVEQVLESAGSGDWKPWDDFLRLLRSPYQAESVPDPFHEPAPAEAPPYRTFCGT